jgi:NADP-dependent 3-hydroxy acid dehydrogenase YdfG
MWKATALQLAEQGIEVHRCNQKQAKCKSKTEIEKVTAHQVNISNTAEVNALSQLDSIAEIDYLVNASGILV